MPMHLGRIPGECAVAFCGSPRNPSSLPGFYLCRYNPKLCIPATLPLSNAGLLRTTIEAKRKDPLCYRNLAEAGIEERVVGNSRAGVIWWVLKYYVHVSTTVRARKTLCESLQSSEKRSSRNLGTPAAASR